MHVWTSKHPHNIMETSLHLEKYSVVCCQQVVLLGLFFFTILWLLIDISMSSTKNLFHFSMECMSISDKNFFNRTRLDNTHCEWSAGYAQWTNIRTAQHCLIVFLNGLDKGGPQHNTLQILNHVIISYTAFWNIQFTTKKSTHNWRTETRNFSSSDQRQWRNSSCSCVKFLTLAADGHG
jgi:hypothetical protein